MEARWLARSGERVTLKLRVLSSSPALGVEPMVNEQTNNYLKAQKNPEETETSGQRSEVKNFFYAQSIAEWISVNPTRCSLHFTDKRLTEVRRLAPGLNYYVRTDIHTHVSDFKVQKFPKARDCGIWVTRESGRSKQGPACSRHSVNSSRMRAGGKIGNAQGRGSNQGHEAKGQAIIR